MSGGVDLDPVIAEVHDAFVEADRVLITGPVEADGDSIGAALALKRILHVVKPEADVIVACGAPVPRRYDFLDGVDRVQGPAGAPGPFDLAFLLDGVRHRIGDLGAAFDGAKVRVLIDHHISSDPGDYDLALLDVHSASTCEIVYRMARHPVFGVAIDRATAQALYTGIVFDTGTFRYSCTTPDTLRVAAELLETGIDAQQIIEKVFLDSRYEDTVFRGRVMSDIRHAEDGAVAYACVSRALLEETRATSEATEGLINSLVFIEGVEVAALFVERPSGRIKISFRSRGRVNVARVARDLSPIGGGHDRAAGVTLDGPMDAALQAVLDQVVPQLRG